MTCSCSRQRRKYVDELPKTVITGENFPNGRKRPQRGRCSGECPRSQVGLPGSVVWWKQLIPRHLTCAPYDSTVPQSSWLLNRQMNSD